MHQTFIRTSRGIVRLEYVSFIRRVDSNFAEVYILGEEHMAFALEGNEANRFLSLIPVAIDISAANEPTIAS